MKNKKQIFAVVASAIVTVFSVVLIASAVTTVGNNVSVGGDFAVSGNATTTGNQVISGNLNVHGAFSPDSFTFNPGSIFTVNGTSTFSTTSFLGDVNFNLKQIKNVVLEKLSNFPSSPVEGQMFWSTVTSTPYWYDASSTRWRTPKDAATIVVAASNSKDKEKADYICDGTADDVEIQAAINVLPATGGEVQLLEGTFTVDPSTLTYAITMRSNTTLRGQGRNTIIKLKDNVVQTHYGIIGIDGVDHVIVEDLAVNGNKANQTNSNNDLYQSGIRSIGSVGACSDIVIKNNYVYDTVHIGIGIAGGLIVSTNVQILDNTVTGCRITAGLQTYSLIQGNYVYGDVSNNPGIEVNFSDSIITNNRVIDSTAGIGIQALSGGGLRNNISNNYVEGITSSSGISLTQAAAYNLISGNILYNNQEAGISDVSTIGYNSFTGNIVKKATSYGAIRIYCNHDIVSDNILYSEIPSNGSYGIGIWLSSASYTLVSGNRISGGMYGIRLRTTSANSTNNKIEGNIIEQGSEAAIPTVGISEADANQDYNEYRNNYITATTPMALAGVHNIVRGNKGYVTENSGTGTITSGNTSTTVSHGLNIKPATSTIAVIPTNNLGSATKFWVSNVATTTFQINTDVDPGVTTATFNWQIGSY